MENTIDKLYMEIGRRSGVILLSFLMTAIAIIIAVATYHLNSYYVYAKNYRDAHHVTPSYATLQADLQMKIFDQQHIFSTCHYSTRKDGVFFSCPVPKGVSLFKVEDGHLGTMNEVSEDFIDFEIVYPHKIEIKSHIARFNLDKLNR